MRRLIVIVDFEFCGTEKRFFTVLEELSSIDTRDGYEVQVRIKDKPLYETEQLALKAVNVVNGRVPVFLNAEPNLAVAFGYTGVHFPENRHSEIEKIVERDLEISVACHSLDSLLKLDQLAVSKILYSPIFKPSWKSTGNEIHGIEGLRKAIKKTDIPVYALGGISTDLTVDCVDAGAAGIAVLSGVIGTSGVQTNTRQYLELLQACDSNTP